MKRIDIKAYLAWASVCFFWGTTYLAIAIGVKTLPVALFSGTRFAIAGLILLLICSLKGYSLPKGREWLHLGFVGFLLITSANALLVWAEKFIPSGTTALLVATGPFWMAAMESFTTGTRLSLRGYAGIGVGFIGLALLLAPSIGADLELSFIYAFAALQLGAFCWSFGSMHSKKYPVKTNPLVGAGAQMLLGGLMLTGIGVIKGDLPLFHFNQEAAIVYLYLIVFGSIVGYGAYIYALDKLPAAKVSTYAYINPVIAVLLGWVWLGEQLNWRILTAMAVILFGVALTKTASVSNHSTEERKIDDDSLCPQ